MKTIALIPARGGSRRVPNKNIKLLAGKPLIAYTIEAAKQANCFNRIIVSTDSKEIAEVAVRYGAEAPFLRPANIAGADSTEKEFLQHALDWFEKEGNYIPDIIAILYPTSPFRKAESITKAVKLMLEHPEADSLRSVRLCSEHPYKMWVLKDNYLKPFVPSEDPNVHTFAYHLLPKVYIQNASIYITRKGTIEKKNSYIGDIVLPFIMDEIESFDINTSLDFAMAELIAKDIFGNASR